MQGSAKRDLLDARGFSEIKAPQNVTKSNEPKADSSVYEPKVGVPLPVRRLFKLG